jgi:hypothetical protein
MSSVEEEWALGSGLPLADADVIVTGCEFGYNPNIGGGTVLCANFTFRNLDSGEDGDQSFTVGNGFEALDKGATLAPEDGKPRKISGQSNYGRLIGSALEAVGGPANMPGTGPRNASTWVGTKWHTGTVKVKVVNPETKKESERDAIVFESYLGVDEDEAAPAKGKAASSSKAKAATPDIDPELLAQLVELAGEHEDKDDFVEAALEVDGVEGNKAAVSAIMSNKPGSIWHTAKNG